MSIINSPDNDKQQKINELEQKIQREKAKLDKELTRKKILLGAFLIKVLEDDSVTGMRKFTADNLDDFLTRKTDKSLMEDVIKNLKTQTQQHNQTNINAQNEYGNE